MTCNSWRSLIWERRRGAVDVATFSEFSSAIHANVFVGALWSVAGKPVVDPINRWGLCCESLSEYPATVMVGEENITSFAVQANEVVVSSGVAALLDHEAKID
jgi:hypothetical protein